MEDSDKNQSRLSQLRKNPRVMVTGEANADKFDRFVAIYFEREELAIYSERYPGHLYYIYCKSFQPRMDDRTKFQILQCLCCRGGPV